MSALSPLIIERALRAAFEEDLGPSGLDITSAYTIPQNQDARVTINARQSGVLSGLSVALSAFALMDNMCEIEAFAHDGDEIEPGQPIATISGNARAILAAERTALNFLTHMSGIASLTAQYIEAIEDLHTEICDTRKTLPGLRAFQKYAVHVGGGSPHRHGLYDAVLIKDNHIAIAGGIVPALQHAALQAGHMTKIEIEVDTLEQLEEVLDTGGAHAVLLDNMSPETLRKAVELVDHQIVTEASGGVTLDTVRSIAESGVDFISVGALTHSAPALDFGLDFKAS